MKAQNVLVGVLLSVGASLFAVGWAWGDATDLPVTTPQIIEFTCEEGDEITESWVGLESAIIYRNQYATNMWEITSNTGDITYFVQRPGQRCSVLTYEIESEADRITEPELRT